MLVKKVMECVKASQVSCQFLLEQHSTTAVQVGLI